MLERLRLDVDVVRITITVMNLTRLLIFVAFLGLGLTVWGVSRLWADLGIQMTLHGWIAYGLGATASLVLSAGLFYLVFKSSREGYDTEQKTESYEE